MVGRRTLFLDITFNLRKFISINRIRQAICKLGGCFVYFKLGTIVNAPDRYPEGAAKAIPGLAAWSPRQR
jgi:hypothetical protein